MKPVPVSRRAVAALFLERQQLDRPRRRRLTARNLAAFAEATGGIQIDSINVVERAHHLTLWSRFGAYDRAALERLIYRKRVLFEYLSHVACFVATSHLPAHRHTMLDTPARWRRTSRWIDRNAKLIDAVERAIAERGPLGNGDFERPGGGKSSGWWDWKPATHALDFLWKSGRIAVHSRRNFQKLYHVADRVLPGLADVRPMDADAARRWRLHRSLHAMGAASEKDLAMYLTWPQLRAPERRRLLREGLEAGDVAPVMVEGERSPWFARTEDLPALERAAARRAPARGAAMLSPFDSFLWHRERTAKLYGFDYRIEVYVPAPKRKFGYYALPLFVDGHLIGRADAKLHRERGVLEFRRVHFEPWFADGGRAPAARWGTLDRDAALAAVAGAAHSLAEFLAADEVRVARTTPAKLHAPLRRALGVRP